MDNDFFFGGEFSVRRGAIAFVNWDWRDGDRSTYPPSAAIWLNNTQHVSEEEGSLDPLLFVDGEDVKELWHFVHGAFTPGDLRRKEQRQTFHVAQAAPHQH